jgi:hypothetical protein
VDVFGVRDGFAQLDTPNVYLMCTKCVPEIDVFGGRDGFAQLDTRPADLCVCPRWHTQLPVAVIAPGVDETVDRYADGVEGAAAEVRTHVKRDLIFVRTCRYSRHD